MARIIGAVVLAALVAAVVLWAIRRGDEHCTGAFCSEMIQISFFDIAYAAPEVERVRACVASRCEEALRGDVNGLELPVGAQPPDAVHVRTSYLDARGGEVVGDEETVRREDGEDYRRASVYATRTLTADGQIVPYTEAGRIPPPSGGPAMDLVTGGRVSHATLARPTGARIRIVRRWGLDIRLDARSRVRLSLPGAARTSVKLEPADRRGRLWATEVPVGLGSAREIVVRLDRRADGQAVEFRIPIVPVPEPEDPTLGG